VVKFSRNGLERQLEVLERQLKVLERRSSPFRLNLTTELKTHRQRQFIIITDFHIKYTLKQDVLIKSV